MSLQGCRIYTALFPCNECAKAIIQSGIKEVIYLSDKYNDQDNVIASRKMLETAGIHCRKVTTTLTSLTLSFAEGDV
jgi:dCMP deaminase